MHGNWGQRAADAPGAGRVGLIIVVTCVILWILAARGAPLAVLGLVMGLGILAVALAVLGEQASDGPEAHDPPTSPGVGGQPSGRHASERPRRQCPVCGAPGRKRAWYCHRCGAPAPLG